MVKFSVISVCLNMETEIRDTIQSVLRQTYTNYEYLIKDGLSSDGTIAVAESYRAAFAAKNVSFRIISSADSGVYDAMNQAIREAKGEWVILMNAGDSFSNQSVLADVVKSGCLEKADIVYGDRILRNQNQFCYRKASALETIRFALPFCHQSTFTRRELLGSVPYSTQYRICSDHRFYLQMYQEGKRFAYYPNAVSIYDINGMSSNWKLACQETIQILEEMPVRDEEAIHLLKKKMETGEREAFLYRHLWRYVPKRIREKRRALMKKNADWKTEEEFFGTKKDNT